MLQTRIIIIVTMSYLGILLETGSLVLLAVCFVVLEDRELLLTCGWCEKIIEDIQLGMTDCVCILNYSLCLRLCVYSSSSLSLSPSPHLHKYTPFFKARWNSFPGKSLSISSSSSGLHSGKGSPVMASIHMRHSISNWMSYISSSYTHNSKLKQSSWIRNDIYTMPGFDLVFDTYATTYFLLHVCIYSWLFSPELSHLRTFLYSQPCLAFL